MTRPNPSPVPAVTRLTLVFAIYLLPAVVSAGDPRGTSPSFDSHVRPVLAICVKCHGPEQQKAGLRLDTAEGLHAGGDSGPAVVAENPDSSRLIQFVRGTGDVTMPPDRPLSPDHITVLEQWVLSGAAWPKFATRIETHEANSDHWSFQPISRPPVPDVNRIATAQHPIDRFVYARLERQGIEPSPPAGRYTQLRRVTLDLLGLPPSPEELDAFLGDDQPGAYSRVVDRLLASPHFGERWGRHWLDLARYADSTGYESDAPRQIWSYRDWVITALNDDLPFDQFVIEQLAGDLLHDATREQHIATGFHCNAMLDPGVREESVIDRVNTTGTVFLGLTLGCAKCHSHKTDPLTQREFYQLYAFFNEATISDFELEPGETLEDSVTTLAMTATPQPTHLFIRGDRAQPGEAVSPGIPAFLHTLESTADKAPDRIDLARWIMSLENPLTARVISNRIWQRLFGRGLVRTEDDFGTQTPPPSHPLLLDWLACEFQSSGWNLKHLLRHIVTSDTYRQSSDAREDLRVVDPDNALLARQQRMRVEAEIIRDLCLSCSGLLSEKLGGPSVFPWQPEAILDNRATPATWTISTGEDRYRRGLYTWIWRLTPHPHHPLFDGPDGVSACTRRNRSNVPVQALTLLNDPTFIECAQALARRIHDPDSASDRQPVDTLFRICLSRDPTDQERQIILDVVKTQCEQLADQPEVVALLSGAAVDPQDDVETAAWVIASRVLFNTDEFITRE